jgi:hypothetical protein
VFRFFRSQILTRSSVPSLSVVRTDIRGRLPAAHPMVFAKADNRSATRTRGGDSNPVYSDTDGLQKGELVFNRAGALRRPPALEQLIEQIELFDVDIAAAVGTPSGSA